MPDQRTVAIIAVGIGLAVLHVRTTGELRAALRELRVQSSARGGAKQVPAAALR